MTSGKTEVKINIISRVSWNGSHPRTQSKKLFWRKGSRETGGKDAEPARVQNSSTRGRRTTTPAEPPAHSLT